MSTTIFTTQDYLPPSWSSLPQFNFYFQIIKDGIILGQQKIKKKQFSLIGRLQDLCDMYINNPTVSRKHAIIQFSKLQPYPYLYSLQSTHGTSINKQRLPAKVYKKLQPFMNIKFGISSRSYILRCPQLQNKILEQEQEKQNQFIKTLQKQNRQLTKQQMKKKYLELLQNDPYFGGEIKSRKFQGKDKNNNLYQKNNNHNLSYKANNNNKQDDGISWGISDQNQVYMYKSQQQYTIQPDVLRRLPGLDNNVLQKITQYQSKYRLYDQIQSQLNELNNKQRREYGLQQKLINKKQKLQKRFVQSLQSLQKVQIWLKNHIFGEEIDVNLNKKKYIKQKQKDTFSDDQFYDRTLEDKNKNNNQKDNNKKEKKKEQMPTVQDLWELKRKYIEQLNVKRQLLKIMNQNNQNSLVNNNNNKNQQSKQIPQQNQVDELQIFMQQNNQQLAQQNNQIYSREFTINSQLLKQLHKRLQQFLSSKQLQSIQKSILFPEKLLQQQQHSKQKQKQQNNSKLQQMLNKLQEQQKKRKQRQEKIKKIQSMIKDQNDIKIFQLYKLQAIQEQNQQNQENQEQFNKINQYRHKRSNINNQQEQQKRKYERSVKKYVKLNNNNVNEDNYNYNGQEQNNNKQQQQQVVDLTSRYK